MGKTVRFITTKRDHLFDVSRILVTGIPQEFLEKSQNPVIISVRGTIADGKKIMPDAAVQVLLGVPDARQKACYSIGFKDNPRSDIQYEGKDEYDEYWTIRHSDGTRLEVDFINAA